MTRIHW